MIEEEGEQEIVHRDRLEFHLIVLLHRPPGKEYLIAAASIVAKVTRDRLMVDLDKQYPEYGFAKHRGYGTQAHMEALKKHGACPEHRASFRPVAVELKKRGKLPSHLVEKLFPSSLGGATNSALGTDSGEEESAATSGDGKKKKTRGKKFLDEVEKGYDGDADPVDMSDVDGGILGRATKKKELTKNVVKKASGIKLQVNMKKAGPAKGAAAASGAPAAKSSVVPMKRISMLAKSSDEPSGAMKRVKRTGKV